MFGKLKSIGNRRIKTKTFFAILTLAIIAGVTIAAGTSTTDQNARTLWAKFIKPLRVSGTGINWLTIGESNQGLRSGVSLVGEVDMSGATLWQGNRGVAVLSGTSGQNSWGTMPSAAIFGANLTGNSGWFLSGVSLQRWGTFLVEQSWPYAHGVQTSGSGATIFSDKCPSGAGKTGTTIYLPTVTAEMHGKTWEFINVQGTTPFVLYNKWGRFFYGGAAGTTPYATYAGAVTGASTIPDSAGESLRVMAIHTPTTVSGWYVAGKNIEN